MAYGNFKDLTRWIASDKIFPDKAFNIAKKSKILCVSKGSCFNSSMVYEIFDKKTSATRENKFYGGAR